MWWLGLTVFTSVLAAPIQEPAAVSCLSFTDGECYSYPQGCSSCKAVVKITGNVYEFTTQLAAPDHDVAALKIIETKGARHVVVCSPTNNTANSYEDQKRLIQDVTNLVTYLDGKATTEHLTCKVELSLVFNGTGSFYVSSGSTVDGQLLFAPGQRVGQQIDEVHGASKIAGILKGKDNTTEPESGSNTAAAPSPKKADPEPTVAATNETASSATPEVSSISSVNSTKSDEENTASTEDVSEEALAAANVTSVADESEPVIADDGKLSEAEIQKKQFEEARALEKDEDDDEQMPSANTTVEEPAKDKKTVATKTFDANKPSETTTAATTKSQPTDKLPAEPKPRSMDDDDDGEEESASTTTKKPVAGKKNAGSTTTITEAPKGEEKDQIIEGDPDHSSALLPFASIIFALCFTLLL